MAQEDFNVSFPNDGLGNALRDAFIKQQNMNTELYEGKVDKVTGKDLSDNNFSDADKEKLDNLDESAEANVQSDWNELDPSSPAFILGKPIFGTSDIIVSAIWTGTGLVFDVIADAFPINGVSYPATPDEVILDAAHATLDRIDLIVAIKPTSPATVGTVGKITGTPASTGLVVPPDFDPSLYYVIKQVSVLAAATEPDGAVNTEVFNEIGGGWTSTLTANLTINQSDPSVGDDCIEATNSLTTDKANFDAGTPFSSEELDLLQFDIKLKEAVAGFLDLYFYLGTALVKRYYIFSGNNGYDSSNLSYQTISVSKSDLNIDIQNIDNFDLKLHADTIGYYLDNIKIFKGSGSEVVPSTGIPEAPIDGSEYVRKNASWAQASVGAGDMIKATYDPTNVEADAFDMDNMVEGSTNKILTQAERDIINGLTSPVLLKGNWDASVGTFPSGTLAGWSYIVSVAGVVDGIDFQINDRLISILNAASTTVYAGNWIKADYSDVSFSSEVNAASAKTNPVDADLFGILDSAASFVTKKLSWVNIKATLKTYFDTLYVSVTGFLEELIQGTATYNATTTGSANLDLSAFATHYAILTGNTTHTLTGLPSSGKSIVKTLYVKSSTTQTYAIANADFEVGAYVADGTLNRITIEATVFPTVGQIVTVTYENLI